MEASSNATSQTRALLYFLKDSKQWNDERKQKQQRLEGIFACVIAFALKLERHLTLRTFTSDDTDGIEQ